MTLNPSGSTTSNSWNYTKPNQPNYTQSLIGTIVAIQKIQAHEYTQNGTPGKPKFWPQGDPVMNQRIALARPDGSLVHFVYQQAGRKNKEQDTGIHMALFHLTGDSDMNALIGKTIQLDTWDMVGANGQIIKYGSGNPRPFTVHEICNGITVTFGSQGDPHPIDAQALTSGPYVLAQPLPTEYTIPEVLANNAAAGGQVQPTAPQNIQVPQVASAPQIAPAPVAPTPVVAAAVEPMQPVQPMVPQGIPGMDPNVAQAMQTLGATNVQPVAPAGPYDENIPF